MRRTEHRIVILGAGLTGAGTALSLANRGIPVTLIDQDETPLNRASLRNEGKIHLGFIYAKDPTLATARLQLDGALKFRALLKCWIGARADALRRSTSFLYLVAKDSLLTPDELHDHYDRVEVSYQESLRADPAVDYLGERPERLFERCSMAALAGVFDTKRFSAAYRTVERAIDPHELARALRRAISDSPNVIFLPHHKVLHIGRANDGLQIEGTSPAGPWHMRTEQVVNALWDQRIAFDRMIGMDRPDGWVHRLKYRVIARLPDKLHGAPSVTMALGPYGDVVVRPNGTAYLSWYPLCLRGWTHDLRPSAAWDAPCRGQVEEAQSRSLAREILDAIDVWYPGIGASQPIVVDAGAIVAYGTTDVGDSSSALHDRTQIGVTSAGSYHSVDPGKLTTAPLFAQEAADRVYAYAAQR